ncbi:hypothetical protein [Robinsoniella peoriensis]
MLRACLEIVFWQLQAAIGRSLIGARRGQAAICRSHLGVRYGRL